MLPIIVFAVTVGVTSPAQAGSETTVQRDSLPADVQRAVERETKGSRVKAFKKEVENGQTLYEVETIRNGRSRDLMFDAAGQVVAVEEDVPLQEVPEPALKALRTHGTLVSVELVTKGKSSLYEGHLENAGKRHEMTVAADGTAAKP
jgi:uncharacterized membrane protein YkoI